MPGYSGTPLIKKLGLRAEHRLLVLRAPAEYAEWLGPLPDGVSLTAKLRSNLDVVHLFTDSKENLAAELPKRMQQLRPNGMIWVSWPKKASKVVTDVSEDVVRSVALPLGLVDVKVCAVSKVWSGLKLVIRKELRGGLG